LRPRTATRIEKKCRTPIVDKSTSPLLLRLSCQTDILKDSWKLLVLGLTGREKRVRVFSMPIIAIE
jgi:hypothetical protein